jgi:hypothetical protein
MSRVSPRLVSLAIAVALSTAVALAGCSLRPYSNADQPHAALCSVDADLRVLWPQLFPAVRSHSFSSFDRSGGNADGFEGTFATLYQRKNGEYVIFDAVGPGVLQTLWFTGPEEGGEGLDLGKVRFYFDGEPSARIVRQEHALFAGKTPPFLYPLVTNNLKSSGAYVSWARLPFQKRLVITTEKKPRFYAAYYARLPPNTRCESYRAGADWKSWRNQLLSAIEGARSNTKLLAVPLRFRHQGSGVITRLRFAPSATAKAAQLLAARIHIRFDDQARPAIDAPLAMFFGGALGPAHISSLAFRMRKKGAFEVRLPMPFWRSVAIDLIGVDGKLGIAIDKNHYRELRTGYLHTLHRKTALPRRGADVLLADIPRGGKLVASVLAVRPLAPDIKRWWEGDVRVAIDGQTSPAIHGTGIEDDHLAGWSNTLFTHPFTLPMHGEPSARLIEKSGVQYNADIALYRIWPGVSFAGSLRMTMEHGNENQVPASYESLVFYYARPSSGPTLVETDRLDLAAPASRAAHAFTLLGAANRVSFISSFVGEAYLEPRRFTVLEHQGPISFSMAPRAARGCWLRRLYDRALSQRARVWVEGQDLGDWYNADTNDYSRWAEDDIFVPAELLAGRTRIGIQITPVSARDSAPAHWSVVRYSLHCIR